jgi:hypothetical protein
MRSELVFEFSVLVLSCLGLLDREVCQVLHFFEVASSPIRKCVRVYRVGKDCNEVSENSCLIGVLDLVSGSVFNGL